MHPDNYESIKAWEDDLLAQAKAALPSEESGGRRLQVNTEHTKDTNSIVDACIVYTNQALSSATTDGSVAAMEAHIASMVTWVNQVYICHMSHAHAHSHFGMLACAHRCFGHCSTPSYHLPNQAKPRQA